MVGGDLGVALNLDRWAAWNVSGTEITTRIPSVGAAEIRDLRLTFAEFRPAFAEAERRYRSTSASSPD